MHSSNKRTITRLDFLLEVKVYRVGKMENTICSLNESLLNLAQFWINSATTATCFSFFFFNNKAFLICSHSDLRPLSSPQWWWRRLMIIVDRGAVHYSEHELSFVCARSVWHIFCCREDCGSEEPEKHAALNILLNVLGHTKSLSSILNSMVV